MSILTRLLGKQPPKPRIRVCIECGMPVAEHKEWCAIRRGEIELKQKRMKAGATTAEPDRAT